MRQDAPKGFCPPASKSLTRTKVFATGLVDTPKTWPMWERDGLRDSCNLSTVGRILEVGQL